ncbi:MAG: DUF1800 domain-containing protein [Lewinellaceae bacterium]|nr:DUF1800 domain-containing protein [Lewinellaceae bacterium]
MDRRATLSVLMGKARQRQASATFTAPFRSSLQPYQGPWTAELAGHLLRRTTFGPRPEQIQTAVTDGLEKTLQHLFADSPLPNPPLNFNYADDPNVPIGETWIEAPFANVQAGLNYRNQSLRAWTLENILEERTSIREKLTLFWHNHFAVNNIRDPKFLYRYITLLRSNAWGNFRELVKAITIDPTMLRFLNGNQNTRQAPNENYARELLELFSIGKGPQVGSGDYTNYTEQDVKEIARALTGWIDSGYLRTNTGEIGSAYRLARHDLGTKQLSHRFGNVVINNEGDQEYKKVVDIIFQQDEVARFICRKLYRYFVYYKISEEVEAGIIEPMAAILRQNDYEIRPALEALLQSEHFFDMLNIGPMIKNPLDFTLGLLKQSNFVVPTILARRYGSLFGVFRLLIPQQMEYFFPPDVAGWKAYYQEPGFYRIWINATTLNTRMAFTNTFAGNGYALSNVRVQINVLELISTLANPLDPNALIRDLGTLYLPQGLTDEQVVFLKEVLIPGLPDFEWTIEYSDYLANPANNNLRAAVETKLRSLFQALLSMPEFYLS